MNQITTYAFFDELEKIGQAEPPRYATKDKLKKLVAILGAGLVGGGLGRGAGTLGARVLGNSRYLQGRSGRMTALRWAPAVLGALGSSLVAQRALKAMETDQYLKKND